MLNYIVLDFNKTVKYCSHKMKFSYDDFFLPIIVIFFVAVCFSKKDLKSILPFIYFEINVLEPFFATQISNVPKFSNQHICARVCN